MLFELVGTLLQPLRLLADAFNALSTLQNLVKRTGTSANFMPVPGSAVFAGIQDINLLHCQVQLVADTCSCSCKDRKPA